MTVLYYVYYGTFFYLLYRATVTDFASLTISDRVTVFGTVFAVAANIGGFSLPATEIRWDGYTPMVRPMPLHLFSPNPAETLSPVMLWACCTALWCFWCFAMLDRVWYPQFSLQKNFIVFFRHLHRSKRTKYYLTAAVAGNLFFAATTGILPNNAALLSPLVGMAVGMTLIWGTRIICSYILQQEAMGFGDVTLMGMIGAFLGWQPCLLVFFLAPFAGLGFGIINWLRKGTNRMPYGPFLSAAAVFTVLTWSWIWQQTADIFSLGGIFIASAMFVCLLLMGVLLRIMRLFRR
ncbi:MAG: A24 family peptidase [Planctomycetaceae bacterium]|jgi:prepilin signal peptidase PulO-like enzyme (type II secretory pathway)|nr:A24 family peptidase [Planctomycetaceae bacterium]